MEKRYLARLRITWGNGTWGYGTWGETENHKGKTAHGER